MSLFVSGTGINEVYIKLDHHFNDEVADEVESRAGNTREILHAMLTLSDPRDRWINVRVPPISPAYSFAELIYVMAGSNLAEDINPWNPSLPKYQGDCKSYPGAYGYRLRKEFGFDQLEKTYEALLYNSHSRQVLMDIWSPEIDFPKKHGEPAGKDIPCNIMSMLKIRNGLLYWTQVMRSNDLFLGLPYDVVLFTSLQEIIAGWLNLDIGEYAHYCDSLHYYVEKKMDVDKTKMGVLKKEDLRLCKTASDEVFRGLYKRMTELGCCTQTDDIVRSVLHKQSFPEAYENMLLIMCMYMLYRHHGSSDLISRCYEKCSNDNYQYLFSEWRKSTLKKSI